MMDPIIGQKATEMIAEDDKAVMALSPKAKTVFTVKALNKLVDEWNKAAPMFGIKDRYPSFTVDVEELPVDFTKLLLMVNKASEDAAASGISVPVPDVSSVNDDRGLVILAATVASIAKNRDMKDWLASEDKEPTEPVSETNQAEQAEPEKPVSDADLVKMISTKMPVR